MSTETVCLSVAGEFITEHARNLWEERSFAKALDLLDCLIGITKEQQEEILFGRAQLIGVNNVELVTDEWTPPEHYCPSIKDALKQGEQFPELERRREDEPWRYGCENYKKTRGSKELSAQFFARLVSMVGDAKAQEIVDEVRSECAAQHEADCEAEDRGISQQSIAKVGPFDMARHALKQRLEVAGFDSSALADPEAMMNRGFGKEPMLDPKMESVNGWLLPDGKYYGCGPMEHVGLASTLLPDAKDGEREAEVRGWIKLAKSFTGFHCLGQKKPTKKQLNRIFDYAQKHGRDYEQMLEALPR